MKAFAYAIVGLVIIAAGAAAVLNTEQTLAYKAFATSATQSLGSRLQSRREELVWRSLSQGNALARAGKSPRQEIRNCRIYSAGTGRRGTCGPLAVFACCSSTHRSWCARAQARSTSPLPIAS